MNQEQGVLNLSSLWEALPPVSVELTILSWNISGTAGCKALPRNLLVHQVVGHINPDVVLLQEVPSDMIVDDLIIPWCKRNHRLYKCISADDRKEARVLYDSCVFEPYPVEALAKLPLDSLVADVVPRVEDELYPQYQIRLQDEQEMYRERVAAIRLRHKATGRVIIFMSFHNKYKCKDDEVQEMATRFCHIVSKAADITHGNTLVVAGADLNKTKFTCPVVHIPQYIPTRRRCSRMIDYFVAAKPGNMMVEYDNVLAFDIFLVSAYPSSQIFHKLQELFPYSHEDYTKSLDHDPLVYKLKIS